jgi:tRNA(Glu) U13 pseudouridine synthase TruD
LIASESIDASAFAALGKLAEGTRRPLLVPIGTPTVRPGPEPDTLVVELALPSGSYATVFLAELSK